MSDKLLEIRSVLAVQDYRFLLQDLIYVLDEYDNLIKKHRSVSTFLYEIGEFSQKLPSPYREELEELAKKSFTYYNN